MLRPTLGSIIKSYETTVSQLEQLITRNNTKISDKTLQVTTLTAEVDSISTENTKAGKIRDNISKMLED